MKLDSFPSCSFDAIIEKGCIDCIFCSYKNIDSALQAYSEACRLLKPGSGKFLSVSYGTAESRTAHMKHYKWDVEQNPVAYSHGISLFVASKWPEATKRGKMKALLKYGALMGRNTSKDKWKPAESTKHSTQTRHADKVAMLSLQGIKMLSKQEEDDLALDPEKGFHIEDVSSELSKGLDHNKSLEVSAKAEHLSEAAAIAAGKVSVIEETDPTDLAAVMLASFQKANPGITKIRQRTLLLPSAKPKRQSAIWSLAKKTMESRKDVVKDDDAEMQVVGEEEWDEMQN